MKQFMTSLVFVAVVSTALHGDNVKIEGNSIWHKGARGYHALSENIVNKLLAKPLQMVEVMVDVRVFWGRLFGTLKVVSAEDRAKVIDPTLRKMGMDPAQVKVIYSTIASPIPHCSTYRHIFLNDAEFFRMSSEEQAFVVAHEASHIKHGDINAQMRRIAAYVEVLLGTMIIHGLIDQRMNETLGRFNERKILHQMLAAYLNLATPAVWYSLNKAEGIVSRATEKRCDLDAANTLGTSQGGVEYFTLHKKLEDNLGWFQKARYAVLKALMPNLDTHPSHEERIDYLKAFAKERGIALSEDLEK